MTNPKVDKKHKGGQTGRPPTKTLEPPTRKSSEQVPAGDDSDINEGKDPEQRANVDDEPPARRENRPIEKDKESRSDENSGCAC
ncbi:MAG TPA: hypothetical protein VG457_10065 [Planctomycetota bacterium]|jgi:hypothetical protein|nr:hypothetical protein [Planctomycetota bacterium]